MSERLPARPLAKWLAREIARLECNETIGTSPVQYLSRNMQIDEKIVRRWRDLLGGTDKPTETQPRETVEDALHRYGALIFDVFPDLADDEPADDDEPARRGGWTRPDRRGSRYTEPQLRALHLAHVRGQSLNALGKQTHRKVGYKSAGSAAMAMSREFKRMGLPITERVDQVRKTCTVHGLAPKHGPRPGYKRFKRTHGIEPGYRPTCAALRSTHPRKGDPCDRPAMHGSEFCYQHDPARQAEQREQLARMRANSPAHTKPMLPIGPFADWLQKRRAELGGWRAVEESCGTGSVHRWGTRKISRIGRDTVERILDFDGTATIAEIYPAPAAPRTAAPRIPA